MIVPTRRAADGSRVLALPKGHVDPGETALQAAEREVREETGIVAEPVHELGEARYWYRRDGRTIAQVGLLLPVPLPGGRHRRPRRRGRGGALDRTARGPDGAQPRGRARDGGARAAPAWKKAIAKTGSLPSVQVLNFYSTIFADELKRGRKTATIRLGDKSGKYRKNQAVLVTIGYQYSPRETDLRGGHRPGRGDEGRRPLPARHQARQPRVSPPRGADPLPRADLRARGLAWRTRSRSCASRRSSTSRPGMTEAMKGFGGAQN